MLVSLIISECRSVEKRSIPCVELAKGSERCREQLETIKRGKQRSRYCTAEGGRLVLTATTVSKVESRLWDVTVATAGAGSRLSYQRLNKCGLLRFGVCASKG